jgi:hypothetical protein
MYLLSVPMYNFYMIYFLYSQTQWTSLESLFRPSLEVKFHLPERNGIEIITPASYSGGRRFEYRPAQVYLGKCRTEHERRSLAHPQLNISRPVISHIPYNLYS